MNRGGGSSRFGPHTPSIIFEVAPFPRVRRRQEPFVRVEDSKVERFGANFIISLRFVKKSNVNITNSRCYFLLENEMQEILTFFQQKITVYLLM